MPITHRDEGFSLLEVLVALVILALGLLGLAAMQMVSLQGNHSAFVRSQASFKAGDILDRMRVNRGEALSEEYDIAMGESANGNGTRAENDLNAWKESLRATLPQGDGSVDVQNGFATIIIQWQDPGEKDFSRFQTETEI